MRLVINAFGLLAVNRFRRRFALDSWENSGFAEYVAAHDYIHTVTGLLPGVDDDEMAVLRIHEEILLGLRPLPKGLNIVH